MTFVKLIVAGWVGNMRVGIKYRLHPTGGKERKISSDRQQRSLYILFAEVIAVNDVSGCHRIQYTAWLLPIDLRRNWLRIYTTWQYNRRPFTVAYVSHLWLLPTWVTYDCCLSRVYRRIGWPANTYCYCISCNLIWCLHFWPGTLAPFILLSVGNNH